MGRLLEYCLNIVAMTGLWLRRRPDIVHVQWAAATELLSLERVWFQLLRRLHIPVVYTAHNFRPHDSTDARVHERYKRLHASASAIVCHSDNVAEQVRGDIAERALLSVQQLGAYTAHASYQDRLPLDIVSSHSSSVQHFLSRDGPRVLFHGTLKPYKGIETLLRAWDRLAGDLDGKTLGIFGPGVITYWRELEDLRVSLPSAESVILSAERLSFEDVVALVAKADVVVFPYNKASQSAALLTAAALSRAVVAADVLGLNEVILHGVNGLLFKAGDVTDLASGLHSLLADPVKREEFGRALFRTLPPARWDDTALEAIDLYMRVLEQNSARK